VPNRNPQTRRRSLGSILPASTDQGRDQDFGARALPRGFALRPLDTVRHQVRVGHLRLPGGDTALCLDHQSSKDENGNDWPVVTHEVYSLAFEARVARKRAVLDAWAAELRRIVSTAEETEQRLVA